MKPEKLTVAAMNVFFVRKLKFLASKGCFLIRQ